MGTESRQRAAALCFAYAILSLVTTAAHSQSKKALTIRTKPGRYYDITLPPRQSAHPEDPLSPMRRKRLIIKCDDLATWSLEAFQRFARLIEKHDAKADFGIIPRQC